MVSHFFSPDQIDELADRIRAYYQVGNDLDIDITNLANKLNCVVYEANFDNNDISGMVTNRNSKYEIYVNKSEPEERKRFTIAHELAHVILHSKEIKPGQSFVDYRRPIDYYRSQKEIKKETQANMLAASLLMPKQLVHTTWNEQHDIDDVAETFNVSKKAAFVRLESLDLI